MKDLVGLFSVVLFFAIPIIALVLCIVASMRKNRQETELKMEIVRSGAISPELAKELLQKQTKKHSKLIALRWGATLVGIGLTAVICKLIGLCISDVYTWLIFALGGGVGLVVAFLVEMIITKHNTIQEEQK